LEDFKSLAKKFVPEKLAMQLAEMASASAVKFKQFQEPEEEQETENEEDHRKVAFLARDTVAENQAQSDMTKLSFDDLVQKVKERLEKDILKKTYSSPNDDYRDVQTDIRGSVKSELNKEYKKTVTSHDNYETKKQRPYSNNQPQTYHQEYNNKDASKAEAVEEIPEDGANIEYEAIPSNDPIVDKQVQEGTNNNGYNYAAQEKEEEHDLPFSKVNMMTNDSYEDYVTPEKEKNIYASKETVQSNNQMAIKKATTKMDVIPLANDMNDDSDRSIYEPEEIKARTENLWDDENEETVAANPQSPQNQTVPVRKGTVIPKRDFYKMSSPNYVAKIPIVAEKYDFNEPIPEKDREPENLKPILGVRPIIINGKIKQV
jgi:hypothetical protein